MPLPHSLRAFRHRDYRLYFAGQGISQTGTWLQTDRHQLADLPPVGLGVHARPGHLHAAHSVAGAGALRRRLGGPAEEAQGAPHHPERRARAVAGDARAGRLRATSRSGTWSLANLVLGLVNAFDSPARQSQLVELVGGREDLPNAIAFSSALMNGARFIGPMIGGAVIAGFGEVWGFGLNSLMRGAVIAALLHDPRAGRCRPRKPRTAGARSSPRASATPTASCPRAARCC